MPAFDVMPLPPLPRYDLEHILLHTRDLWEEVRGKSIFITGGTGFFGMWLLETLAYANDTLHLGVRVVVLSRDPQRFKKKAPHIAARADIDLVAGDVRSFSFPPGRFPLIIHGAAEASAKLNEDAPGEMFSVIVDGTRRVLSFAEQAGTEKFLLISSGAVYGPQPAILSHIPEEYGGAPDPLLPASAYAEGKRVAEHLCAVHARRFGYEAKFARCFAFVGPHLPLDVHFAIGNFIGDALAGRTICIKGDGSPSRSYLYAADLIIWLWHVFVRSKPFRAYNVGSPSNISISALAREVARIVHGETADYINILGTDPNAGSNYVPSVARAERELGLNVSIGLGEAIARTAAWWKSAS